MSIPDIKIDDASDTALIVMQAVIAANEEQKALPDDGVGPLALARAMSDFFEMASALENSGHSLARDETNEIAAYALDLCDRLAAQTRELKIMDQKDNLSRVVAILSVWFARRGARLHNLQASADGFAWLTNKLDEPAELAQMCVLMDEVAQAASDHIAADQDRTNPWRPWRVLNLNIGVAATRSLDTDLIRRVFDDLIIRIPDDVAGFFADGVSQLASQDVPEEVGQLLGEYAQRHPSATSG